MSVVLIRTLDLQSIGLARTCVAATLKLGRVELGMLGGWRSVLGLG
jgi:hypothetical protein